MRSELTKAVKKRFEARLTQEAPQFLPKVSQEIPAGCRLFAWPIAPDFFAFLLLVIARDDRFTVEGAWSRDSQFPGRLLPGQPEDYPNTNINEDNTIPSVFRFRIARLWHPRGDVWWEVIPRLSTTELHDRLDRIAQGQVDDSSIGTAIQRVEPLVDDAIHRVVSDVIPYFVGVARSSGVALSNRKND